jgi:1-acyl-sn-glycerol-3-phosphate acyltransferase
MGVRFPLRALKKSPCSMPKEPSKLQRPGALRWSTVGAACYLGWGFANLTLALFFPVLLLIEFLGGRAGLRFLRALSVWFLNVFFLKFFSLVGVYSIGELPSSERLCADGKRLFVSNHRSWLDALLLIALIPDVRIPISTAYMKVPLIGRVMRWLGCIPLDRGSRESIAKGVEEMRNSMRSGVPIAAFPEGTRSAVGRLKPFLDLFFKIAIEEDSHIAPMVVHLSSPFLGPGKENFLTARGTVLRIRVLEEIKVEKGEKGVDVGRRAHKRIASELADLDSQFSTG